MGAFVETFPGDTRMRLLITASLLATVSLAAWAQSPPATIAVKPELLIQARQSAFALSGGTFQGMEATVKGGGEVKGWAHAAGEMAEWAEAIPTMFPPGTEKGGDTKALAKVWSDSAGFAKAAGAYSDAAKTLQQAAKDNDKAAFAAAFKTTGKACGACHKAYRAKD